MGGRSRKDRKLGKFGFGVASAHGLVNCTEHGLCVAAIGSDGYMSINRELSQGKEIQKCPPSMIMTSACTGTGERCVLHK